MITSPDSSVPAAGSDRSDRSDRSAAASPAAAMADRSQVAGSRRERPLVLNANLRTLAELARADRRSPDHAQLVRLLRWQRQSVARQLLPEARVARCFRVMVKPFVELMYSRHVKRAHYAGLVTCGSVWDCPVCAAKITERRRIEIESVDMRELSSFMVTLTLQHKRGEKLKIVRDHLTAAYHELKRSRSWVLFANRWQIVADVAGTEITYGLANGWHPHKHVLFWSRLPRSSIDADEIREAMSRRFEFILAKRGRYAHALHGVNVRTGDDSVAEYVAKFGHEPKGASWSLAAEITKGNAKTLLRGDQHYTPFQLLDLSLAGDALAGALFREYAVAMFRSAQLRWSRGGRAALGLVADAPTDEELAAAGDEDASLLALLTPADWKIVRARAKRGHLLEVASRGNYNELVIYMRALGAENFGREVMRSCEGPADHAGT